jgi:hypothetical protein
MLGNRTVVRVREAAGCSIGQRFARHPGSNVSLLHQRSVQNETHRSPSLFLSGLSFSVCSRNDGNPHS